MQCMITVIMAWTFKARYHQKINRGPKTMPWNEWTPKRESQSVVSFRFILDMDSTSYCFKHARNGGLKMGLKKEKNPTWFKGRRESGGLQKKKRLPWLCQQYFGSTSAGRYDLRGISAGPRDGTELRLVLAEGEGKYFWNFFDPKMWKPRSLFIDLG